MTDATNKTKTKKEKKNTRKIDKGSDLYPGVAKSEYIVFFVIIWQFFLPLEEGNFLSLEKKNG